MNIFIHARNHKLDIESQAEILCAELEKIGHSVEWSNQTHPARLLLNKYDVIHVLTESMPLSWKNFWIVAMAKALQLPVVVSSYATQKWSQPFSALARLQLSYFEAISVPEVTALKSFRSFSKSKFIFPAFIRNKKTKSLVKGSEVNVIFYIENEFQELPDHKWILQDNVYINATRIYKNKSQIEIKKLWVEFINRNPIYQNSILILNAANLEKIMSESKCLLLINYLKIHSVKLATLIQQCLETNTVLIMNESQASGTPEIWCCPKYGNKNGIIQNFEKSFTYPLSLTELIEKSEKINFKSLDPHIYESQLNELSRLYVKIKNQKDLKISYAHMSRRP